MAFAGRLAVIAGGLGGLGSATGKVLLDSGARVALLYAPFEESRASSILESTFTPAQREMISAYACDISDEPSVTSVFDAICSTSRKKDDRACFGAPSILVNSAGYISTSKMEETSAPETQKHLSINVLGPMLLGQAFARAYFRATSDFDSAGRSSAASTTAASTGPPGRIVNIASQAAHVALNQQGAYCASKAAVLGLTRSMASEWGPRGITANSISPTVVLTAMGRKAWADDAVREAFIERIPTKRFALPEEIAQAVAYLCRDDAGMINGADLRIDGGVTIE